jgi:3-methyl-2-oxobutanoate hydroxymethyltransferase
MQTTAPDIAKAKGQRKLVMITAYDHPTARILDPHADMLLVGDSLAMVVLGHPDTLSVTLDEMLHHTRAVSRTAKKALVVGDLPIGSYQQSVAQAVDAATRMVRDGGARAVKMEGAGVTEQVRAVVRTGIPVMGHVGLTPQFTAVLGGFKVQAKTAATAAKLLDEALALQDAGCFAIVLEAIPPEVAREVTSALSIPTIGIGAGVECDGQVLVVHDVAGLAGAFRPKFVKKYADLETELSNAAAAYANEVRSGAFPGPEHVYPMDPA